MNETIRRPQAARHHALAAPAAGWRALGRWSLLSAGLAVSGASHAIDFGPFSLNGFAKVEVSRASKICGGGPVNSLSTVGDPQSSACQLFAAENRERPWADALDRKNVV